MKTRIELTLAFCCFLLCMGNAQMGSYTYKRSIETPNADWHSIRLPIDIQENCQANLSDLRIYGLNAAGDTLETPFLLVAQKEQVVSVKVPMKDLNRVRKGKRYFFTFELPGPQEVNTIQLRFGENNFDWEVDLEGSQDLKSWYILSEQNRVVAIQNQQTNYSFSTLEFPTAQYTYFRISLEHDQAVNLLSAQISNTEIVPGNYYTEEVKSIEIELDKKKKRSRYFIDFEQDYLFSQLTLKIKEAHDYYRPIKVEFLSDSSKTEKGWIYHYRHLASGVLASWEKNQLNFPQSKFRKLRLTINNEDNAPLTLVAASARGYHTELHARFDTKADYYLCYGKKEGGPPQYDLANFKERIPKALSTLQLGQEEIQDREKAIESQPLFANKGWLWGIMLLIIGVLGSFTLRMMRNT